MLKASVNKYQLKFKRPAGTSRGVYRTRDSWIVTLWDTKQPNVKGVGECAPLPDLSCDFDANYEDKIKEVCASVSDIEYWLDDGLMDYPSIRFGFETAFLDFKNGGNGLLFDTPFVHEKEGILINGLIWMGNPNYMREQIQQKLEQGFHCIKLKIGANDIEDEMQILQSLRKEFPSDRLELRVDANGAFSVDDAPKVLEYLAAMQVHSIEQPIRQKQQDEMAALCKQTPIPIALDEELIGVNAKEEKTALLDNIKPQYIILKPSLHGGIAGCLEWIDIAKERQIGWWITSALESNIGLNAIAQWTASLGVTIPQGLGTGLLFTNNFESPLYIEGDRLYHRESF